MKILLLTLSLSASSLTYAERIIVQFHYLSDSQIKTTERLLQSHALVSKPVVFKDPPHAQFNTIDFMNNNKIMSLLEPLKVNIKSIKRQVIE